jgi:uncharacterized membrane protein
MWILTVLPDWVIHLVLIAGILGILAGFVLTFIPALKPYKFAIQVCSILVMSLGVYLEGGLADYNQWQLKIKEVEAKLAEAQAVSQQENVKIVTKVVKQLELVRVPGSEVVKYVDREVVKYDNTCPVPAPVVKAHNAAALNKSVEETK